MNILLAGGGTGGHVYPALAVAEALRRRDPGVRVLFMGSRAGMEASLVPRAGIPFVGLAVCAPRSWTPVRLALSAASVGMSLARALAVVARFKPDAMVATGGIAALPAVIAGAVRGTPVVVLEGNAIPGRTNRLLARCSRIVAVSSGAAAGRLPPGRTVVTGLPIRREVYTATREEGLGMFDLDPGRRTVLIIGGSQGASRLNTAAEEAVGRLADRGDLQVIHQTGQGWGGAEGRQAPAGTQGALRYVRVPYLDRIGAAYASADLVVSRCGANALAEITACALPAILVPYPHAADNHQAQNATRLVSAGAAVLVADADLTGDVLAREIAAVFDRPGRLAAMAAAARHLGRPDAADQVAAEVVRLAAHP